MIVPTRDTVRFTITASSEERSLSSYFLSTRRVSPSGNTSYTLSLDPVATAKKRAQQLADLEEQLGDFGTSEEIDRLITRMLGRNEYEDATFIPKPIRLEYNLACVASAIAESYRLIVN